MLVSLLQLLSFGKQWFFYILFLIRLRGFRCVLEWQPHVSSQVREFEENGVVLLRGVIPEWVPGQIFFACLKQTKHELKMKDHVLCSNGQICQIDKSLSHEFPDV